MSEHSVIVLTGRQQVISVPYRTAVHAWQMAKQQGVPVEFPISDDEYITVDPASEIKAVWGRDTATENVEPVNDTQGVEE